MSWNREVFWTRDRFGKPNLPYYRLLLPSGWELVFKYGLPAVVYQHEQSLNLVLIRYQHVGKGNKRRDNFTSDSKMFEGKIGSGVWQWRPLVSLRDGGMLAGHLLYPGERDSRLLRIPNESIMETPAHQQARGMHYGAHPPVRPHQTEVVIFICL